jgi:hypothetical protein
LTYFNSCTPRYCRDDRDLGPFRDLRLQSLEEPDVLSIDVDVDEATELPGVVEDALLQAGVRVLQRVEDLLEGMTVRFDPIEAIGERAELGGDLHNHCHVHLLSSVPEETH